MFLGWSQEWHLTVLKHTASGLFFFFIKWHSTCLSLNFFLMLVSTSCTVKPFGLCIEGACGIILLFQNLQIHRVSSSITGTLTFPATYQLDHSYSFIGSTRKGSFSLLCASSDIPKVFFYCVSWYPEWNPVSNPQIYTHICLKRDLSDVCAGMKCLHDILWSFHILNNSFYISSEFRMVHP